MRQIRRTVALLAAVAASLGGSTASGIVGSGGSGPGSFGVVGANGFPIGQDAASSGRAAAPIPRRVPPRNGALRGQDVLLIVLDAARADALSIHGALRATPAIDALAAEGTRVERALAPAAWTAPSIGSLLTGLHPAAHGVDDWTVPLPPGVQTLPEAFREAGYATHLWSSHTLYRANRGLRAGFERTTLLRVAERAQLPTARNLGDGERPRFNMVHLLVPHSPYEPPPPFAGRYTDEAARTFDVEPATLRELSRVPGVGPADARVIAARDRYDEMVAWADEQVRELLEALEASGRADRTLVIVTADHGEAFMEHGLMLHTRDVHDEMVRVPLIFRWPPAADFPHRSSIAGPASLVDISATLVDLLDLPWIARVHGRSLVRHLGSTDTTEPARPLLAYATARGVAAPGMTRRPEWLLLESPPHKLITDAHSPTSYLYDMNSDPGETTDLSESLPELTLELRTLALAQRRADRGIYRRLHRQAERKQEQRP